MIIVEIGGAKIGIKNELLEKYQTMRNVRKIQKDPLAIFDFLDLIIDGGADRIAEIIDPENNDPDIAAYGDFVEKVFAAMGEQQQIKNLQGS